MKGVSYVKKRMIAFVAAFIMGLSAFAGFSWQANAASASVQITGGSVNVRSNAGLSYSVIGKARKGSRYSYISQKKAANGQKWYCIQYSKSKKGWVISKYAKYISNTPSTVTSKTTASASTVKRVQITGKTVNIRKGAGASYAKLATAKKGGRYDYLARKKTNPARCGTRSR